MFVVRILYVPRVFLRTPQVEGRSGVAKLTACLQAIPPTVLRVVLVSSGEGIDEELGPVSESALWTDLPEHTIIVAARASNTKVWQPRSATDGVGCVCNRCFFCTSHLHSFVTTSAILHFSKIVFSFVSVLYTCSYIVAYRIGR